MSGILRATSCSMLAAMMLLDRLRERSALIRAQYLRCIADRGDQALRGIVQCLELLRTQRFQFRPIDARRGEGLVELLECREVRIVRRLEIVEGGFEDAFDLLLLGI